MTRTVPAAPSSHASPATSAPHQTSTGPTRYGVSRVTGTGTLRTMAVTSAPPTASTSRLMTITVGSRIATP